MDAPQRLPEAGSRSGTDPPCSVLKWATGGGYAPADLAGLEPPANVKCRDRVLTREELAVVVPTLRDAASPHARAMWFMLLTLARREEVASARWRDLDLQGAEWRIPETKNGVPHRVSLSPSAVALLRAIRPATDDQVTADARAAALVFATAGGTALADWARETKRVHKGTGTAGWQRHDLRRTGATLLGELGTAPHVVEAALNHASIHSRLAAAYNRARYRPEVRTVLALLADRLDGIARGGAEVVLLEARRVG